MAAIMGGEGQQYYTWDTTTKALCGYKDVTIKKVANGFIVTVGCKTLVTKTWKEASEGLGLYWKDPEKAEKKYTNND